MCSFFFLSISVKILEASLFVVISCNEIKKNRLKEFITFTLNIRSTSSFWKKKNIHRYYTCHIRYYHTLCGITTKIIHYSDQQVDN